ncbi:MAG TPA: glutaredoxin family protein [Magnetospirillaceae bacterium]|nr:glutaredoxin family protein [Magnetospirillaceae bacterium]
MATENTPKKDEAVVVYSSPTCGFCHMAMEYFDKLGVKYTEKDITVDQDALTFILEKVGQAVTPIITVGQTIIVGFDRPKIDEALKTLKA